MDKLIIPAIMLGLLLSAEVASADDYSTSAECTAITKSVMQSGDARLIQEMIKVTQVCGECVKKGSVFRFDPKTRKMLGCDAKPKTPLLGSDGLLAITYRDGRVENIKMSDVSTFTYPTPDQNATIAYRDKRVQKISAVDILAITIQTPVPQIAGTWKVSEFGDITVTQSGRTVAGTYTTDRGTIFGTMDGSIFQGYWVEDASNTRCATPRDNRYYWGRVKLVFDGNNVKGAWGYCEAEPTSATSGTK